MRNDLEGIQHEIKGLQSPPSQITDSHRMEKILKIDCSGVNMRLYSMEVKQEDGNILDDLQHKFLLGYLHLEIMNINWDHT